MSNSTSKRDIIRSTVLALLTPGRAGSELRNDRVDGSTRLLEVGLIDSPRLLDIILEVESRCGVAFNPELIDPDISITLDSLISAFDPVNT